MDLVYGSAKTSSNIDLCYTRLEVHIKLGFSF